MNLKLFTCIASVSLGSIYLSQPTLAQMVTSTTRLVPIKKRTYDEKLRQKWGADKANYKWQRAVERQRENQRQREKRRARLHLPKEDHALKKKFGKEEYYKLMQRNKYESAFDVAKRKDAERSEKKAYSVRQSKLRERRSKSQKAAERQNRNLAKVNSLLDSGDQKGAILLLRRMDAARIPIASQKLGQLYLGQDGVKQDYKQALGWFLRASHRGSREASFNLGQMYFNGWGTEANLDLARQAFENSKTGDSQYALGCMYSEAVGTDRNYTKSVGCFRRAISKNRDPRAMSALGELAYFGLGQEKDLALAKRMFEDSAKEMEPKSLFYLEKMYATGNGAPKNEAKATQYKEELKSVLTKYKPSNEKLEQLLDKDIENLPARYSRLESESTKETKASADTSKPQG